MIRVAEKWRWPLLLTAAFVISRIAYYRAGVRFDLSPLFGYWQYVDLDLLRHDLVRSVYYLHSQPPLFNLYLGLVVKVFGGRWARDAFWASYLLAGLALHLAMYFLAVRLRARPAIAASVVLLFTVTPAAVLYENWLFYAYPVTTLLCLATLFLHRYLDGERARDGVAFFGLAGAMTLTWSLFAGVWFVGALLFVGMVRKTKGWRPVLAAAAVPLVVIGALYVKNGVLFGSPSTTSWTGMNIAGTLLWRLGLDPVDRERLIARGELSALSRVNSFMPVTVYDGMVARPPLQGVPVLDREWKARGIPNYHHLAYVEISRRYLEESWRIVTMRPGIYLEAVRDAYLFYALPASDVLFLGPNRARVERLDEIASALLYGSIGPLRGRPFSAEQDRTTVAYLTARTSFLWLGAIVVALGFAVGAAWRAFARRREASPEAATLLFIALNVLFVTLAGNAVEVTENNRFRFTFDPLIWVVLAVLLSPGGRGVLRAAPDRPGTVRRDAGLRDTDVDKAETAPV
jgi:hypothetical protein